MTFVTRAEWGARDTVRTQLIGSLPELVVHHVAGRHPVDVADEHRHMRELQAYAINTKGYQDIDYNLIVGPSGTIYEARGIWARSAATLDRNGVSRSICAMGNYETRVPTPEMLAGIVTAGTLLVNTGAVTAGVHVYGHRDNPAHPGATACPGRNLYTHINELWGQIAHVTNPQPQREDETSMIYITNGSTIWALMDDGTKRELGYPTEYELRGSPVGVQLDQGQLAQIPDHQA